MLLNFKHCGSILNNDVLQIRGFMVFNFSCFSVYAVSPYQTRLIRAVLTMTLLKNVGNYLKIMAVTIFIMFIWL